MSAGVLYSGAMPMLDAATQSSFQTGQVGAKGTGGVPGTNDGIPGTGGLVVAAP
jgi:hypothetical protein